MKSQTHLNRSLRAAAPNARRAARWTAIPLAAALVVGGAAACGGQAGAAGGSGGAAGGSGGTLTVGVQFGLTGADAAFDAVYQNSAKIVFNPVAQSGIKGTKVVFDYADDASDPATAVSLARQDVAQDHASVLYGPAFTPTALSTKQTADSLKVPFYTPGSINPGLTTPLDPYTFAPAFSSNDVADGIAKLANSLGVKKVGMLEESDSYGQAALQSAQTALAKYGLKVNATQEIASDATDATSQIRALQSAGVGIILLGVTAPPMTAALNAEISSGFYAPMVTFAGSDSALDKLASSDPKIKYYALTPLACPLGDPCTADFMKAWKAAYPGQTPIVWTAQAYAAAKAFIAGLQNAPALTPAGIAKGLETMQPYSTPELPCPIQFSAQSHKGNSCTNFYGITGGKLSFFGSVATNNQLAAVAK